MTRRFSVLGLALAAALCATGCDAVNDTRPDAERIVGTFAAASANVRVQGVPVGIPVSDLAAAGDEQTFSFRSNGSFAFHFDPADGRRLRISYNGTDYVDIPLTQTVDLAGTYTLDDANDRLTFSTVSGTTADDFVLRYRFTLTTDGVELIAEDAEAVATLATLFGVSDSDYAQLAQFVTGGSVTYTRE